MKVNVLGTEYTIEFHSEEDDPKLEMMEGYMDFTTKKIVVCRIKRECDTVDDLICYQKKIMRHEIIHAFFYESGLWSNSASVNAWGQNEEMTDWIAIQFPKISKAFEEAGCL